LSSFIPVPSALDIQQGKLRVTCTADGLPAQPRIIENADVTLTQIYLYLEVSDEPFASGRKPLVPRDTFRFLCMRFPRELLFADISMNQAHQRLVHSVD
jgi:hypothetical protein